MLTAWHLELIKNVLSSREEEEVTDHKDDDLHIDIEAIIKRHGRIVPVTREDNEVLTPRYFHSSKEVGKYYLHRGDRGGRTPKGKTLHDKKRGGSIRFIQVD